ncbi:MAG TPA: hypothetical protein GX711_07945, partial [Clostridia bacterium]|nr:hypothetical protein [Clostridia bacterium]
MNKLTAAQWRKKVEKEMEKIPEKVWETITEHKKMDHIQEANEIMEGEGIEQGLAYLIEVVEQEMTSFERYHLPLLPKQENQEEEKGRETLSREMPPDKRFQAWSDIVAVLANNEKDIISFRQEVLNGQLLKPEEVPQWIEAVREKEGFTTGITLKFTAGDGWEERLVEHAKQVAAYAREGKFYPGTGYGEGSLLSYVKPGSE